MAKKPKVFLFDMDHTLIDNDCDVSWKHFIVKHNIGPANSLERADYFYGEYKKGTLDLNAFMEFQLAEFRQQSEVEMAKLADWHFKEYVQDKIYPDAAVTVKKRLKAGERVAILTSTNRVLAAPLACYLGINHLLATDLETIDGCYTGFAQGVFNVGKGKITLAERYCKVFGLTLADAAYYGDGYLDRYILDAVGFPIAVNPAPELKTIAKDKKWPILKWEIK